MSLLGVEPALYSILTYVAAARTLDFVIYGLEEYTAITIVSARSARDPRADHRRAASAASRSTRATAA